MRLSKRQFQVTVSLFWQYVNYTRRIATQKVTLGFLKHFTGINSKNLKITLYELSKLNILIERASKEKIKQIYISVDDRIYEFNNNPNTYSLNQYSEKRLHSFNFKKWRFDNDKMERLKNKDEITSVSLISRFVKLYADLYDGSIYNPVWKRDRDVARKILETFEKNGYKNKNRLDKFFGWCKTEGNKILENRDVGLSIGWLRYLGDVYIRSQKKREKSNSDYDVDDDGNLVVKNKGGEDEENCEI